MRKLIKNILSLSIITNFSILFTLFSCFPNILIPRSPNLTILQSTNTLKAQSTNTLSFFGYYEGEFDQVRVSDATYNYGYNKLRLDLEGNPDENVTIAANLNILKYDNNTTLNLLDFLPESIWKPIFQPEELPEENWVDEFPLAFSDTLYLDNIYLRANFKKFDITIGKQQISLGTGYTWNPIDIFNFKQLLDPTYEQTGINAVRLEVPFGSRSGMDMIYSPNIDWKNSAKMLQFKTGIGSFDLIGSLAQYNWIRTDFIMGEIENERNLIGGALVGEIAGIGLWAEGAWNQLEGDENFSEFVIGSDYTFENGLYILMEYLYNQNGVSDFKKIDFNRFLQYFNGEIHSLMQQYIFNYINYPLSDLVQLGFLNYANLNDNSIAINPQIIWDAFQDVSVSFMGNYFIGETDTEFGLQDWGWRIRIRGYF